MPAEQALRATVCMSMAWSARGLSTWTSTVHQMNVPCALLNVTAPVYLPPSAGVNVSGKSTVLLPGTCTSFAPLTNGRSASTV